jgi:uncharacterized Zn-binding protein involved in type VI secretion
MPAVARLTDLVATGHLCDATAPIQGALQFSVTIDGLLAAVTGDLVVPHFIKVGKKCLIHPAVVTATSSKVFIGALNVARIGDPADLGVIITGSPKVFIGS